MESGRSTISSPGSVSTCLSTITEMNLDEPNKMDTETTSVESKVQAESEQGEEQTMDHSALKSAIHSIMGDSVSSSQTDHLRKDIELSSRSGQNGQLKTYEQFKESQSRAKYYNQAFAVREQPNATRERLIKTSILTAEIKTNVIIQDEYTFLTTMSSFLAARYNRPESSVLITLHHSACMLFGGSFDPAYLLTISAVSEQIKPTMNRRNAMLVQQFLAEELLVPAERGVVKFYGLPEENLANAGMTLAAEIQQDTKSSSATPNLKEEQTGFGLTKRLSNHKKRITTRLSPQPTKTTKDSTASPPASPPSSEQAVGLNISLATGHSRSTSDATTSSDPEIDVLKGGLSQKTPPPISSKKSSFFRKLKA